MPEPEQTQGRRSIAQIAATFVFAETSEQWNIEASPGAEAGPHPIRVLMANESTVTCHFLTPEEAEDIASRLLDAATVARTGLIVTDRLPPPEPNGHR